MAETTIEKRICEACGSEIRSGALFCYHCGGAVENEVKVAAANGDSVSSGWFRENISDETEAKETTKLDKIEIEDEGEPIKKPIDVPLESLDEKSKITPEKKLKSAAEMRRKSRLTQKNRVEEIVWQEHENAPNGWFMIIAVILIFVAGLLFYLAIFVK